MHKLISQVEKIVNQLEPELVKQRRDFHKYAESAWTEFRTASLIARRLHDLGYEVKLGQEVVKAEDRMGVPAEAELERHYQRASEQGADPEFLPALRGGFTESSASCAVAKALSSVCVLISML